MRVVEDTSDRLVLHDVPLGPGLLLLLIPVLIVLWGAALWNAGEPKGGMILIGIAAIFFFGCFGAFVRVLSVRLDKDTGLAEVTKRSIFGTKRTTHALKDLQGATLQSMVIRRKPGDRKDRRHGRLQPEPRVWRAAFVHRNGNPLPLTEVYGSEKDAGVAASAINGWFGRPDG